ncbi:hypothetical protein ASPZODRAFT_1481091 [Penicilliopsis zonata CBS 506.65]|uniref:Uncharacterized protein n=1 Tax=Penicilliopsis zonata CBS 506.65 TaxID=1073090 RepID=A0A1L9SQC5_9EURO|nr:hypothetical protein ASPZODRAFT_1481091 [Penicilliopsis zonata CBS 506.65]OJJ49439.1 hypothetical protein ASPZODRAFT_1481091 [Penicilliopsis zonata CBS 506.65]
MVDGIKRKDRESLLRLLPDFNSDFRFFFTSIYYLVFAIACLSRSHLPQVQPLLGPKLPLLRYSLASPVLLDKFVYDDDDDDDDDDDVDVEYRTVYRISCRCRNAWAKCRKINKGEIERERERENYLSRKQKMKNEER